MKTKPLKCMVVDDDEVSRSVVSHLVEKNELLELVYTCENAIDAHNILLKDKEIDVLFLDIEMPEMSGLELVQILDKRPIRVILTTSREDYAVEAFEYSVFDYLVKPITYPRFLKSINKIQESLEKANQSSEEEETGGGNHEFLFVRSNHKIIKIDPKTIAYIEALSDYIVIHTISSNYTVHSTMKGINSKLEPFKSFVRVHRSYIINVEHIETIQDVQVIVKKQAIPIGRSYRSDFMERLDIL